MSVNKPKPLTHTADCNEYERYVETGVCICHPRKPKAPKKKRAR